MCWGRTFRCVPPCRRGLALPVVSASAYESGDEGSESGYSLSEPSDVVGTSGDVSVAEGVSSGGATGYASVTSSGTEVPPEYVVVAVSDDVIGYVYDGVATGYAPDDD